MNPIAANDTAVDDPERGAAALVEVAVYRVFVTLPAGPHRQMKERAHEVGKDLNVLYQEALQSFARSLACGVRLPLLAPVGEEVGAFIQLSADRRSWVRRSAARLKMTQGDLVAAAALWWPAGGAVPAPTIVARHPGHDPPH